MGVSDVYTYLVAYLNSSGLICNKVLAIVTAGIFLTPAAAKTKTFNLWAKLKPKTQPSGSTFVQFK